MTTHAEMPLVNAAKTTTLTMLPRTSKMTSLSKKASQLLGTRPRPEPPRTSTGISQPAVKRTIAAVTGPLLTLLRTVDPRRRRPTRSTVAVSHLPCRQSTSAPRKCWRMRVPVLGSSNIATQQLATVTKSTEDPLSEPLPSVRATSNGKPHSSSSLSREHPTIPLLATRARWSTPSDTRQPRLSKTPRTYETSVSSGSTLSK